MNNTGALLSIVLLLLVAVGCKKTTVTPVDEPLYLDLPAGFPDPPIPADNQLTVKRVELGKLLFFDKGLSIDSSVSCASCHFPELAFSDNKPLSFGVENRPGFRNSPPLFNLAWHNRFFKDGGVPTLELQVIAPVEEVSEMDHPFPAAIDRMATNPIYQQLAEIAYDRPFDGFVLTRAISAYERTLISGNSRYDQYKNGAANALSASEKRGMELFFNQLHCTSCHSGFDFADYDFKNNGLYEVYADSGRTRVTLDPADRGKFKTPSLRNVELTGPYMHDGSLATLEQVVAHYNSGGSNHPAKAAQLVPLNLTNEEQQDLVNFLKSLTDETFVSRTDLLP